MLAISWMVFSGILGALSNFCMRRSLDGNGSPRFFFILQLFLTFLVVTCLYPIRNDAYSWNFYTVLIAFFCGISLGLMKIMIGNALLKGPPGLTFATVNSASVMPAIIITLIFGTFIDFKYTFWNFAGSILVVCGLFWAVRERFDEPYRKRWLLYVLIAFVLHLVYLVLTQTHIIIVKEHLLSFGIQSEWFFPLVFFAATFLHMGLYGFTERRSPELHEVFWGILGGILNGLCAFLFVRSAEIASGAIQTFIFPIFSVTLIIGCNLWGRYFYDENINWSAHGLCLGGLFISCL